jgi:hypothetical protein
VSHGHARRHCDAHRFVSIDRFLVRLIDSFDGRTDDVDDGNSATSDLAVSSTMRVDDDARGTAKGATRRGEDGARGECGE